MADVGQALLAGGGRIEFERCPPHALLKGRVSAYVGYREHGTPAIRRRELPSGNVVLIVNFGAPFRILDPRGRYGPVTPPTGFIAGLDDGYSISESTGDAACVEFKLTPATAHALLRERMSAFFGRVADLEDLFGAAARRLSQQLFTARDWPGRFAVVEAFLLARLAENPSKSPACIAVEKLRGAGGNVPIGALAAEIGCSRKHLVTLFRDTVGVGPKAYAQLLRLDQAVTLLQTRQTRSLTDIALTCGYYDQAHFIRAFRRYTGETPGAFLARALPGETGWMENSSR